ncbi:two pore domain potassium channel family protein [Pleurocapsales cyanobacterium LEGE 06147]|nr:two pore domain potassium channel family protein [Pleurocapsales cyanobacterium LEGE 06147]
MNLFVQIIGWGLVILALTDIYLTVLRPRANSALLSVKISRAIWQFFRLAVRIVPLKKGQLLSHSGSIILIAIVVAWVLLLLFGFALIVWQDLGSGIQASQGQTPTDFLTALYYSGFSLTTLGTGDIVPKTDNYRLLMILQAALGFSTFTLTITYILSIYSALIRRNTFALSLYHRADDMADSAEMLARLAADNSVNNIQQDISNIARDLMNLLETQNSYSVLVYFRFQQTYYALPRIAYLAMDTATLIKTALDVEQYRSIVNSSATAELWNGGLHLLVEVSKTLLPKRRLNYRKKNEQAWRARYYRALERLKAEGIKTAKDPEAGALSYISLRHEWAPHLSNIKDYMQYEWSEIAPTEY